MEQHALEPERTDVRPSIAYVAAAFAALLAALVAGAAVVEGAADSALGAAVMALIALVLATCARRIATRGGAWIAVDDSVLTIHAPRSLRRDLVLGPDDVREVIVDPEGVAVPGGERLRFPASPAAGERRFLYGRTNGTRLGAIRSQEGEPNVAIVFVAPRVLPPRASAAGSTTTSTGIAVQAADPLGLADAVRALCPTRVVERPSQLAVALGEADLEVAGVGEVVGRGRRAASWFALIVFCGGLGVAEAAVGNGAWKLLATGIAAMAAGAALGFAARRRRPRGLRSDPSA